jgi:hypothetical protein
MWPSPVLLASTYLPAENRLEFAAVVPTRDAENRSKGLITLYLVSRRTAGHYSRQGAVRRDFEPKTRALITQVIPEVGIVLTPGAHGIKMRQGKFFAAER